MYVYDDTKIAKAATTIYMSLYRDMEKSSSLSAILFLFFDYKKIVICAPGRLYLSFYFIIVYKCIVYKYNKWAREIMHLTVSNYAKIIIITVNENGDEK